MGFLDKITDRLLDGALDAAGFGRRKYRSYSFNTPSEVNALPVVYGRPGWINATPVALLPHQRGSLFTLYVDYVIGEGLQRVPDALIVNGYLDEYSKRYVRTTEAEQVAVLGAIADKATGSWVDGFGQKAISSCRYHAGFPRGAVGPALGDPESTAADLYKGCAVMRVAFRMDSVSGAYITDGSIPDIQVLPNGIPLHDPRIDPDIYSANYLYAGGIERAEQVPRWDLGGVAPRWHSQNIEFRTHLNPTGERSGLLVGGRGMYGAYERRLGDDPDANPALVVLDYLTAPIYGAAIPLTDIDLAAIVEEANYCDAPAPTYTGGPSQEHMRCDIQLDTDDKLRDNLQKVLGTCRGSLGWIDGQYRLKIRKAGQPVAFIITERHIIKRASLSLGKKTDRLNRVVATYIDGGMRYKERQVVYPSPASADFTQWLEEDGQLLEKEITLHGVNNVYRAVDLANTLVRESRAGLRASYYCTLELLQVTAGDLVRVTDDKFSNKLFYVESVSFSFKTRQVLLNLREQDEQAYDTLLHPGNLQDEGGIIQRDNTALDVPENIQFAPAAASNLVTSGQLSWDDTFWPTQHQYSVAIIRSGESSPLHTGTTRQLTYNVPYLAPGNYIAQVRLQTSNLESAPAQLVFTLDASAMPLPAVSGLRLAGGGINYTGDAAFEIDRADDEPAWLAGYEWRIYAGATLLRTRVTSNPAYTYRLSENLADGGHRTIRANVRRKSISGEYGPAAELEVTQPAPAAPSGISITTGITSVSVAWQSPHKCRVYLSTTPGFSPSPANQVYVGTGGAVTVHELQSETTHYVRIVPEDAFGTGNGSGELSTSTLPDVTVDVQRQIDRINQNEELAAAIRAVIGAGKAASAGSFSALKEVVVENQQASVTLIEGIAVGLNDLSADYTEYKRTAIGYCVDANGNPTDHDTAVSCELAGNTWQTAPLAEAFSRSRIALPGGGTAQAGLLLQSLSDGVDELTARAALAIDVNGRVSGLFLEGSETASALDIVVDSFRIKTAGGSKTPFEVVGDEVRLVDAVVSGTIDIQGYASFGGVKIGGAMPIIRLTDDDDVEVGLIGYEARVAIPGQKNPTRMIELGSSSWTTGLVYLECNNAAGDQFAAIEMVTGNGRAINTDGSIVGASLSAVAGGLSTLVAPAKVTTPQVETTSGTALITTPARTSQIRLGMSISGIPISRDRFPASPQEGDVYRSRSFSPYSAKLCVYLDGAWRVVQTTGAYAPGDDIP